MYGAGSLPWNTPFNGVRSGYYPDCVRGCLREEEEQGEGVRAQVMQLNIERVAHWEVCRVTSSSVLTSKKAVRLTSVPTTISRRSIAHSRYKSIATCSSQVRIKFRDFTREEKKKQTPPIKLLAITRTNNVCGCFVQKQAFAFQLTFQLYSIKFPIKCWLKSLSSRENTNLKTHPT